jgi:hypothetical protein
LFFPHTHTHTRSVIRNGFMLKKIHPLREARVRRTRRIEKNLDRAEESKGGWGRC